MRGTKRRVRQCEREAEPRLETAEKMDALPGREPTEVAVLEARAHEGEQGEAMTLWGMLLGALGRQPEMLEPRTERAAAEAKANEAVEMEVEAKANDTVETEDVYAHRRSWAETRSVLRESFGLACQENVGLPPSSPVAAAAQHAPAAAAAAAATVARTDSVLTNEMLKTSIMIDKFLDYAFIYDGGIKKYWIVYNIHAIKADDLEILAQQLAAEHEVERTTMLRALLAMVSLRERGWQEPSASSLSGTHAGMPDFTRLVSFIGAKEGQILDTGLIYNKLPEALLPKVLKLAKFLRMELSAPGKGLIHCMNRAEAAAGLKYGDPCRANEMIHSDQLAADAYCRGAIFLDPPSTVYGGEGNEKFLGCFVTGTDSATMCYIVVRAVPALAVRRTPKKRARNAAGGAFVGDITTRSNACERLAAIALAHAHAGQERGDELVFDFATIGQNAFNLGAHLSAVLHSRNTVGGVSWLPAELFGPSAPPWTDLPFAPRRTVRYHGTSEILLTEAQVREHALMRYIQCSLTASEQAAECARVLRAQPNPSETVCHLFGAWAVGSSDAEGAPMVTGQRGGKRSRGKAASSPANGMAIPQIAWAEVPVWAEIARDPDAQQAWITKEATTPPIVIENLSEEGYLAAEKRWLGPRARETARLQNDFAAFLKQQRTEFKDDEDRNQFLRALWLNPGLHPTLVELGIEHPGRDSDLKRRRKFEKWKKKLAEWADAERAASADETRAAAAAEGLELVPSSSNETGFKGVSVQKGGYQANLRENGTQRYLGTFASAGEAALSYARHVGAERAAAEAAEARVAVPQPLTADEARAAAAAEGLELVTSASSETGFKGVYVNGGRYMAQSQKDGQVRYLGKFTIAEEAALCYARHVGAERAAAEAAQARVVVPQPLTADEVRAAAVAEGLELVPSLNNETRFKGVYVNHGGYLARICEDGKISNLGTFTTAKEAALCYARHVGAERAAAEAAEARIAAQRPLTADEARAAAAAKGLELVPSFINETGFKGVFLNHGGYQARNYEDGKKRSLGTFATAEEAALCYAGAERAAAEATEARIAAQRPLTADEARAAAAAEGLELMLSSNNKTGFVRVIQKGARYKVQRSVNGKQIQQGNFATPWEAALWNARNFKTAEATAKGV